MKRHPLFVLLPFIFLAYAGIAQAKDYVLTIKDHVFFPATLTIPAKQKVRITIHNQDNTPAEFESYDLGREKVISGNSKSIVFVGPLKAGTYHFFDDFHKDTTTGILIAE